jgi:integrase
VRKTTSRLNFTKRAIAALDVPQKTTRALHYDSQVRGLGVMIQPSGHRAFFWFRKVQGRPTWKTIGPFPDLTVEQARARAAELNAAIARWKAHEYEGAHPINRRRDLTLNALFEDYLERRLKPHAKDPERAIKTARWQFNGYLTGWRERKLGTVSRADVRFLHADVGEKNGKVTANRTVQLLRTLFNWAVKTEMWSGQNPAHGIVPFPESSRTRFLQPHEAPKLFKALSQETNIDLRDFVLLALFTGARRSNVLAMRWEQIELKRGLWSIPDPKSRIPYVVPLTDEAVEILNQRRRNIAEPWVFPSRGRTGHVTDLKRSWAQFLTRAKIDGLRIHDLRRTLGSWQAGAGVSLPVIGKTLGHQSSDATEIYARLHLDPVRKAIDAATGAMIVAGKVSRRKLLKAANRE